MLRMQAVLHNVVVEVAADTLVLAAVAVRMPAAAFMLVAEVGSLPEAEEECMHRPLADPGISEATVEVFTTMEQAAELISPNGL